MAAPQENAAARQGPSAWVLRATLAVTITILAAAALLHVARYILLMVNRTTLLHPLVAAAATWLGVLASVAVLFAVAGMALVLTEWLVSRRAAAFGRRHHADPRPLWALRAGCLVPVANLFWAPAFLIELAVAEDRLTRLRRPIYLWWLLFAASTAVSFFASATSFTSDPQGIADNTLSFVVAYLLALAAVAVTTRLLFAFDRSPAERPANRWIVVADDGDEDDSDRDTAPAVEQPGQEPAA